MGYGMDEKWGVGRRPPEENYGVWDSHFDSQAADMVT
jgi:hypothetical protein